MKKFFSFAVTAMAILGLGSLTSCHDEDLGVSTAVLQERAFEQGFINEFGQPSADQSWDFYAQKMEALRQGAGVTRAAANEVYATPGISLPEDDWYINTIRGIAYSLEDEVDNSTVGQNNYSLTATGNFNIYAVLYAGYFQRNVDWDHKFELGIAFIPDGSTQEKRVPLFTGTNEGDWIRDENGDVIVNKAGQAYGKNPELGATVTIPEGTEFYFYMQLIPYTNYGANGPTKRYYSNAVPTHGANNQAVSGYYGCSTLLYSQTRKAETEGGEDEQVMMIGFEDGWYGNADHDFNDVVVLIEGKLPVPSSKRFFCEDKESLDWDYNDVVFDVENTGIVLRAVGGTLPVWLEVTNRLGTTTVTQELHTLMRSLQKQAIHQNEDLTFDVNENGETVTYYKPIDVGSYANTGVEGLWFDPVQIITWTQGTNLNNTTRLQKGEVELFANPNVDAQYKKGDIKLIVGTKYGQDVSEAKELAYLASDANDKRTQIITMGEAGKIPAIWTAPVSVGWMKEMKKITLGYPYFYGGGDSPSNVYGTTWWEKGNQVGFLYDFDGDKENN